MARQIRNVVVVVLVLVVAAGAVFYVRPFEVIRAAQRVSMRLVGVQSRDVQLPAGRIHYLVLGEGRPLVLVHGFASDAESWFPFMRAAAREGFKVYALDLLGFGDSEKPDVDYAISRQIDVVRQFLDSQGLQKVELGGISMGGWVSLSFAHSYPERVERLVVFDAAGMAFKSSVDARATLLPKTPADLSALLKTVSAKPQRAIPDFIARDGLRMFRSQEWVLTRAMDSMGKGTDLLDGKLDNVRMPVLIVWGKQDALVPLAAGEAMHREMPQSELKVFDGCGHIALMECEAEILPVALQFLKGGTAPTQAADSPAQP